MTRAGVLLTAALAAASLGLFAQDHATRAASPSAASSTAAVAQTGSQNPSRSPAAQPGAPSQSTPAARDSSSKPTTASPNRAIEGSASNDPATPNGQLPQTSTILPLLGLIGLGSLVAGLFARR